MARSMAFFSSRTLPGQSWFSSRRRVSSVMPRMAFFLVFFTLSSIGLPGLNGFVAEFLVLLGTLTSNADGTGPLGIIYAAFAALGIILGAIYMLYLCQRVLFGPLVATPSLAIMGTATLIVQLERHRPFVDAALEPRASVGGLLIPIPA